MSYINILDISVNVNNYGDGDGGFGGGNGNAEQTEKHPLQLPRIQKAVKHAEIDFH